RRAGQATYRGGSMDSTAFDRLTRSIAHLGTRRWLLGRLATLPLVGLLAAIVAEEAGAEHPHDRVARRTKQRHRKQRTKRGGNKNHKKQHHHPKKTNPHNGNTNGGNNSGGGGGGGLGGCESPGQCICTPLTCPNGCCDANGVCQPGNTEQACGD